MLLPLEQRKNPKQHYRTYDANQQLAPESRFWGGTKQTKKPAAQETANDTNENAYQKAHAFVHDFASDKARNRTY